MVLKNIKIYVFIICALCTISISNCIAQNVRATAKGADTARIDTLMGHAFSQADPNTAIQQFNDLIRQCLACNYLRGAIISLGGLGGIYANTGNIPEGMKHLNHALELAEKLGNSNLIASCHEHLGTANSTQGNYVQAAREYYSALKVIKEVNHDNIKMVINVYTNLTVTFERMGDEEKELYYLNKTEQIVKKGILTPYEFIYYIAQSYTAKGDYYTIHHQLDSAIKYDMEALKFARQVDTAKKSFRLNIIASAEIGLGAALVEKGEYKKAIPYLQNAISVSNSTLLSLTAAKFVLGNALFHLQKYKEAETVLLSGVQNCQQSGVIDNLPDGFAILVNVYKATQQYKKALEFTDSLVSMNDSLMNIQKASAIGQLELKYNTAEKDKQIAKSELLIALQKNKIIHKNIWIGFISAGIGILALFSFMYYRNNRMKQEAIIKSLKQENTISVLQGIIQGEESERSRIARELHDGVGGMLSATKMSFMALKYDIEQLAQSPKYVEAIGLLDVIADEIRITSHNLTPEILLKQDLTVAIEAYCNNIQKGENIKINFQSYGNFDNLSKEFKLNVYRIVQELIKNILQHAEATQCMIQLLIHEHFLTITAEDNGKGFDTDNTKDGIGLHNLKTRVLSFNGKYTVKSEIGKGTTIYIEFDILTLPALTTEKYTINKHYEN